MSYIDNIYEVNYMKNYICYVGTLRNEKKFKIDDRVFFATGNAIHYGIVIGVEKTIEENPEYLYKIKLEKANLHPEDKYEYYEIPAVYKPIKCTEIFNSIEDAQKSATLQLENMYKLQKEEIERYFKSVKKNFSQRN